MLMWPVQVDDYRHDDHKLVNRVAVEAGLPASVHRLDVRDRTSQSVCAGVDDDALGEI